jgi:transglutaminase-like putative cysteine protease
MPATRTETAAGVVAAAARPLGALGRVGLAGEIVATYARARLVLRRAPLEKAVRQLRTNVPPRGISRPEAIPSQASVADAVRLGRAVSRTLALLPGDTRCLTRSLVLSALLARRGIPARLVLGARTEPSFLAHAWVECAGTPVLDPGDGSFGRLVEI